MTPVDTNGRPAQSARIGIGWMLITMFLFVSMDVCAKFLIQDQALPQVVWARYFFHFALLAAFLGRRLGATVKTTNLGLQLIRSLLLFVTTALFFLGLRFVPLADAAAMMLIAPVIVTALSLPMLGEPVGPRRWAGVAVGFLGALIIIRPTSSVMQVAILLPFAAAVVYAFYQISTRFLSRDDQVLTTLFYTALTGTIATTLIVPFYWTQPNPGEWVLLVLLGLMGGLGHFTLIKALTSAPIATVAPFTYTNMIWAVSLGWYFFGDLPDRWTIIGACLIAGSGLYILHRETRAKNPQ